MIRNMGRIDRAFRAGLGVVGIALGIWLKTWWGLFALIPLLTAAIGYCPLYVPFRISTIKKKQPGV